MRGQPHAAAQSFGGLGLALLVGWAAGCQKRPGRELPVEPESAVMSPQGPSPLDALSGANATPGTCADGQAFYDRLFARDDVEATIAFGYLDEHLPTIRGYIRHTLLKLDPVPVFLNSQEDLLAETRTRFVDSGYVEVSRSPTGLVLVREFRYRGRPKTLRVHVVFSIARCPGERVDEHGRLWRYDNQTCPEQQRATTRAKARFAGSFATSGIAVYHGHARLGWGLDFGPLSLDEGKLSLDCESLHCGRPEAAQTLVFVNGCDTVGHYADSFARLRRTLPPGHELAWLGTRGDVLTMNAPEISLRLLNEIIAARCPKDVLAVMNLPRRHPEDHSRVEREGF